MTDIFAKLKRVDNHSKDLVFGYIRRIQNALSFRDIPPLVCHICLSYYYEDEFFSSAGTEVTISNDRMTIFKHANISGWSNTSYGNIWIDSHIPQIAKWTIRTKSISANKGANDLHLSGVYVFFLSHDGKENEDCTSDEPVYGIADDTAFVIMACDGDHAEIQSEEWRLPRDKNIVMVLNTNDATISCITGDKCVEIFTNIKISENIRYKLGINLYYQNDSVSLLDFECTLCE
eukprot:49590_1